MYINYAYWVSPSVYCYIACTTIMPTGLVFPFTVILHVQQLCRLGKSFRLLLSCVYNNYAYWVGSSVYYYQCVQQLCLFGKPIKLLLYCRYNNYAYWVSLSVYCYLVCTTIMPTGLVHQFTVILQVQQLCLLG